MEYKGDEQPSLNNAGQPRSLEQMTVPASLLPSVLSRLGLGDMMRMSSTGVDKQLAAFKDDEITVRVATVRSLEQQGETTAIESLLAALNDSAWEVRAAAVWALGKFGEQAPLEALTKATDDVDGSVRAAALRTLGLRGAHAPKEPLIQALDDPNWQVREIAILTLGELGEQAPLEPLVASVDDEHAAVREAARMALEQSHPEALSAISIDPIMITQESGRNTVFRAREQEQPGADLEVETGAEIPSIGDSPLTRFTAYVRALQSRVVRDLTGSSADSRSTTVDEETNDEMVSKPGETRPLPQQVQTKPRHLRHIAEGVLAALIIAGLVASWLAIEQRLHPSQGSTAIPLLTYHGHVNGPAVWSSDSKYVSIVTDSSPAGVTMLVWNRATGQLTKHMLHALGTHPQENQPIFAPDGKHFAFVERTSSNEEVVQVWDAIAWRSILTTYSPFNYLYVFWSSDSTRIVIPAEDGTMQAWNVGTGHELVACHFPPIQYLPYSSFLSPDGRRILVGNGSPVTYVLDLTTCKLLTLPSIGSQFTAWSLQGNRFATISPTDDRIVQAWDVPTWHNLASFHLTASVSDILWTPDGKRIVTSGGKEVNVLDVATQRIVLRVVPTNIDGQPIWALSPDGRRIASLSGADTVQIWDVVTGRKLNAYQSPGSTVKVVAWSPDSRIIATGSTDGTVRIWYADTAPETHHGDSSVVLNIVWSPDGKSIATGDLDGNIWVWQVRYSGK
jgi:WD40 repeat protein